MDRLTQPSLPGCHFCKLQDQAFAFIGRCVERCVVAFMLSTGSTMRLIDFQLHAAKLEWKAADKRPWYYVSPGTQVNASCHCVARNCKRSINSSTSRWHAPVMDSGSKKQIHGFLKETQYCVHFPSRGHRTGALNHRKAFRFCKSVYDPILTYCHQSWVWRYRVCSDSPQKVCWDNLK